MKPVCTMAGCDRTYTPSKRRKTTLCRQHAWEAAASRPDRRAAVSAGLRTKYQEPGWKEKRRPIMVEAGRRMMEKPELAAKIRANMQRVGREHGGSVAGSEERQRAARTLSNTKLAHIPLGYREDYMGMNVQRNMPAAEREQIVQEMIVHDTDVFLRTGRMPQLIRKGRSA